MTLYDLAELFTNLAELPQIISQVADHDKRISTLETKMATTEDVLGRINDFSNNLANDISGVTAQLNSLKDAIASGNQTAVSAAMDQLTPAIDRMQTVETQLHQLAADPANPVPTTTGTDTTGAGTGTDSTGATTTTDTTGATTDTTGATDTTAAGTTTTP